MKFKNKTTGDIVDASHAKEGDMINGERASNGDWLVRVSAMDTAATLMKPVAFFEQYEYIPVKSA